MFSDRIGKFIICFLLFIHIEVTDITGYNLQDQTSPKANTLFDDADDIQRQLDNEVRDRIKYGRPKTIWVFHFPQYAQCKSLGNHHSSIGKTYRQSEKYYPTEYTFVDIKSPNQDLEYIGWDYMTQDHWHKVYPDCGGRSQSPVDLPFSGVKKTKGARPITFLYFDVQPTSMTVTNDGQRLVLSGVWPLYKRPMIHGGAAYSRRYLFHSLTLHWPSEHLIGGLTYPLETQALFVSAEYKSLQEAVKGSHKDSLSMLSIASIYKYGHTTHEGLKQLLNSTLTYSYEKRLRPKPLGYFTPPFKKYVAYQGSLTVPPCTEAVLWIVRANSLYVERYYPTEYTFVDIKSPNQDLEYIGWDYMTQDHWHEVYPDCGGRSQSPVDLPFSGVKKTKGARPITFLYFDVQPTSMTVTNDGQRLVLSGVWPLYKRPMIHGGAAYSRRYLFHSLTLHWPSEHLIGGLTYPLETQALFVSAEYKSLQEAVKGSHKDSLSMLSIASIYKYGHTTHEGLKHLLNSTLTYSYEKRLRPKPLGYFTPPFKKYVVYQGSLTVPPCTEAVLWIVRANSLYVEREYIEAIEKKSDPDLMPKKTYRRHPQPLNDRKCFMFQ